MTNKKQEFNWSIIWIIVLVIVISIFATNIIEADKALNQSGGYTVTQETPIDNSIDVNLKNADNDLQHYCYYHSHAGRTNELYPNQTTEKQKEATGEYLNYICNGETGYIPYVKK